MSHLLDSLLDPERRAQCEANDRVGETADERARHMMPDDIHEWAPTPAPDNALGGQNVHDVQP